MNFSRQLLPLVLLFAVFVGPTDANPERPPLLLISLDGFRWDYCEKFPDDTPNLRRLIAGGVRAERLIPVFPSNTFPNHYSLVTGLYPSRHGMINNLMTDSATGEVFNYKNPAANRNPRWWGGEPIWITAAHQGRKSACYFWVGSEARIHGVHATHWFPFNYSIPFEQRLATLLGWLQLPAAERPAFIAFYLEETNGAGHAFGPAAPETAAAVRLLDERIGAILDRVAAAGLALNLIIVADHGMTETGPDRALILDEYLDLDSVQVDFTGSVAGLRPLDGDAGALQTKLAALPHARALLTRELPTHFHMRETSRTPAVWILPEEGWQILRRAEVEKAGDAFIKGDHGYDPALSSMGAIFIAHGPSFRAGVTLPPVESIHVYNLMCAALGLTPAPNDGDDRLVRTVLRD